mgnify:CR=1 FL=1
MKLCIYCNNDFATDLPNELINIKKDIKNYYLHLTGMRKI